MLFAKPACAEQERLLENTRRDKDWQRWGTYLAERQWGTVREDYSSDGSSWSYFPYEMARYRAYRWGEDGLLGWTDRKCRLTFATALWNHHDSMLKERFFGLTNEEGNHGEDVKELYYYLDATPTHSYAKALYRYPQAAFPYADLRTENKRRAAEDREYELLDTGVLNDSRFFDVTVEYAKADAEDILIRITVVNQGPDAAVLSVLPTLTFRNTWSWPNLEGLGDKRPSLRKKNNGCVEAKHSTLGDYRLTVIGEQRPLRLLFTENETNERRMHSGKSGSPRRKDAFDRYVVHGSENAIAGPNRGTRCALHYELELQGGEQRALYLALQRTDGRKSPGVIEQVEAEDIFNQRIREADEFYAESLPKNLGDEHARVARQAYAGLLWSKQFYFFAADQWFSKKDQKKFSTPTRLERTKGWEHLFCRDVLSMPDKWEYPWFAAWDLAFHAVTMSAIDPEFAKAQLLLLLREWYSRGNGQMPAYEYKFSDNNPPVHAWAVLRVYQRQAKGKDHGDLDFLERAFQKLLLNFTWWTNRLDSKGKQLFGGGFLGLDNISLFNRSTPLPEGLHLNQADGNAWMGVFIGSMLQIAVELSAFRPVYADVASMFAEDYIKLAKGLNTLEGTGLWDDKEGFYFDQLNSPDGWKKPLRVKSLVGLAPLFAVCLLESKKEASLEQTQHRLRWFLGSKPDLQGVIARVPSSDASMKNCYFASFIPEDRLRRILSALFDEEEFLSDWGFRSLSRKYKDQPFKVTIKKHKLEITYSAAEATDDVFGGNSNWRGPVWFPMNSLLIGALDRYGSIYGDRLQVEFPTGSGRKMTLQEIAKDLRARMLRPFLPGQDGSRPVHGKDAHYTGALWKDLLLFYEYFSGDDGRGVGASHQTGWTALAADLMIGL